MPLPDLEIQSYFGPQELSPDTALTQVIFNAYIQNTSLGGNEIVTRQYTTSIF